MTDTDITDEDAVRKYAEYAAANPMWAARDHARMRAALEAISRLPYWEGVRMITLAKKALEPQ